MRHFFVFFLFVFTYLNAFSQTTISAFISGNDTICENSKSNAEINFSFNGVAPHTFTYSINGDIQPSITTMNPFYFISTKTEGVYDLVSYFDANEQGNLGGQAIVTIKPAPTASFTVSPDTITNLNLQHNCMINQVVILQVESGTLEIIHLISMI